MTISLRAYVAACDFKTELHNVNVLLETVEAKITFWGGRVLESSRYQGSISLDKIARKTLHAANERSVSEDLSIEERVTGVEIVKKIRNFYSVTDTQISNRNFFTRLLNFIREFTFWPYTPRFHSEEGLTENYFRGFSENQYTQEFNKEFRREEPDPNSDGSFGPPLRIMIKEDILREKSNSR